MSDARPHVVIVGGGFGGLRAARTLRRAPVSITLIDRTNHHLFQPLLYQVAMAGLSPADIAAPIRTILRKQKNVSVVLAEVTAVDLESQTVATSSGEFRYDFLVLAAGGRTSYFGHDEWEQFAPGLKDLSDAVEIRRRVLLAFEAAEREPDVSRRKMLLTFIVVGGGPTGVELAGAIAELARFVLARDFQAIHPESAEILLLESGDRILTSFTEDLSSSAVRQLAQLGVKVRTNARVTAITANGVFLGSEFLPAANTIWGAGVQATPLTEKLGLPLDRGKRVIVNADLTAPLHPNVFVIGDMATFTHQTGHPLPGVSPVAMQMGDVAGLNIRRSLEGNPLEEFHYFDKGSMATIGRSRAIAQLGKVKLTGFAAWMAWLMVHIFFLIGFRNRAIVLFNWTWSYLTYQRGARLITGRRLNPPNEPLPTSHADHREGEFQLK
jgi:NADH:ubiquinone reductase (H+-translocating)